LVLSESNVVMVLMSAAQEVVQRSRREAEEEEDETREEPTLKVVLSALWNLSAHCGKNKVIESFASRCRIITWDDGTYVI
jgi:hypothetical protein